MVGLFAIFNYEKRSRMAFEMEQIYADMSKLHSYLKLQELVSTVGESEKWGDSLWQELLEDNVLFDEFMYFLNSNSLLGNYKINGYSIIDAYVKQMDLDNMIKDTGKNTEECSKVKMVLHAFEWMAKMKKNPEDYKKKMEDGPGMDRL